MKLTAKEPYKAKSKRFLEKVIRHAHYKDIETGKFEIKEIEDEHGKVSKTREPIIERVFVDALRETQEVEVDVWIVETEFNGQVEKHEFANVEDAKRYFGGFN